MSLLIQGGINIPLVFGAEEERPKWLSSRLRSRIAPPGGRRETAGTGELVSVTRLVGLGYASYEVASAHFCWIYETVLFAAILSARGTHSKPVLGIQLVKVKYFFLSCVD